MKLVDGTKARAEAIVRVSAMKIEVHLEIEEIHNHEEKKVSD